MSNAFNYSYYAPISSSGIGTWVNTTRYPINLSRGYYWEFDCSDYNGHLYCPFDYLAGGVQFNYSYYSSVNSAGISAWTPTAGNYTAIGSNGGTTLIYNNYLYAVGSAANPYTQVRFASLSSAGMGTWRQATTYPIGFSYGSCVAYNSTMYCVGSYNSTYGSTKYENYTYYAHIWPNGLLGAWNRTTNYPTPFYDGNCDAYGGSIFCIGGVGVTNNNRNLVYSAPLLGTGIGAWSQQPALPASIGTGSCQTPASGGGFLTGGGYYQMGTTTSTTTSTTTISGSTTTVYPCGYGFGCVSTQPPSSDCPTNCPLQKTPIQGCIAGQADWECGS